MAWDWKAALMGAGESIMVDTRDYARDQYADQRKLEQQTKLDDLAIKRQTSIDKLKEASNFRMSPSGDVDASNGRVIKNGEDFTGQRMSSSDYQRDQGRKGVLFNIETDKMPEVVAHRQEQAQMKATAAQKARQQKLADEAASDNAKFAREQTQADQVLAKKRKTLWDSKVPISTKIEGTYDLHGWPYNKPTETTIKGEKENLVALRKDNEDEWMRNVVEYNDFSGKGPKNMPTVTEVAIYNAYTFAGSQDLLGTQGGNTTGEPKLITSEKAPTDTQEKAYVSAVLSGFKGGLSDKEIEKQIVAKLKSSGWKDNDRPDQAAQSFILKAREESGESTEADLSANIPHIGAQDNSVRGPMSIGSGQPVLRRPNQAQQDLASGARTTLLPKQPW